MEKIDEQLNNISLTEVPIEMHRFIMRKINYKKIQPVLFVIFASLALSFIVIVLHINAKLVDAEFADIVQDFFEVFSFNFSFINAVLVSFFEIVSPLLVVSMVLSLVGAIYTGKKISFYRFAKM